VFIKFLSILDFELYIYPKIELSSLYEETSQDSQNRLATADSKLMVLIDFVEHIPTIY
jgi:hypothetical protein